jgi:hypothetical protein
MNINLQAAHAETTYVYCAEPDGSHWDWFLDSANNYVTIEDAWGQAIVSNNIYYNYFSVSSEAYHTVSIQCPLGEVAQPGNRHSSYWEVFNILNRNGGVIADGHMSIINDGSSSELRVM